MNSVYKERNPLETVDIIRTILYENNIDVVESYWSDNIAGVYSCRIEIQGTNIGSNGKGISVSYALASAYAELMERLQTHMLFMNLDIENSIKNIHEFKIDPNERTFNWKDDKELPISFKTSYMFSDKFSSFEYWKDYIKNKSEEELQEIIMLPFTEIVNGNTKYLPANIVFMMAGSNGLCAGNSKDEALSQGLAEIFERYVLKKIYLNNIKIPNISQECLERYYPSEYEMIQKININTKFTVCVKDCTFNNKYPVIGIIVYDTENMRYSVNLGADADLRVALQRCLTEVFQGSDTLNEKSNPLKLILETEIKDMDFNYQLKNSSGKWSFNIFNSDIETNVIPINFHSLNEKYNYLVNQFREDGINNIFIRNCTFSEINTYQIIIPGYSEAFVHHLIRKQLTNKSISINMILENKVTKSIYHELLIQHKYEYGNSLDWIKFCTINLSDGEYYEVNWKYLLFSISLLQNNYGVSHKWLCKYIDNLKEKESIIFNELLTYVQLKSFVDNEETVYSSISSIMGESKARYYRNICKNPFSIISIDREKFFNYKSIINEIYLNTKKMQNKFIKEGNITYD